MLDRLLQHKSPDDYILATGETHTVREFIEESGKILGMDIIWKGKGLKEKGVDKNTGKVIIEIDPIYFRPAEVDILIGDYSKAKKLIINFTQNMNVMASNNGVPGDFFSREQTLQSIEEIIA